MKKLLLLIFLSIACLGFAADVPQFVEFSSPDTDKNKKTALIRCEEIKAIRAEGEYVLIYTEAVCFRVKPSGEQDGLYTVTHFASNLAHYAAKGADEYYVESFNHNLEISQDKTKPKPERSLSYYFMRRVQPRFEVTKIESKSLRYPSWFSE